MTTFVILAAGRGTRIGRTGEYLHKALVPLGGKAILSHLLDLAPPDAEVVVCTGHRADQINTYLRIAHPRRPVRTVYVDDWDVPGVGGPGWSLLAARKHVRGDLIFTSCDTLWAPMEYAPGSWLGVAPLPVGTAPERWCRVIPEGDRVLVADKVSSPAGGWVHTGMGQIAEESLREFWDGLSHGTTVGNELQMSSGFGAVSKIRCHPIDWTDVGDAEAYHQAVELHDGYDWSKTNEATYLLPEEGRVVKFHSDLAVASAYQQRAERLCSVIPKVLETSENWTATQYRLRTDDEVEMRDLLRWAEEHLWRRSYHAPAYELAEFYADKTYERIYMLPVSLADRARQALLPIDWSRLYSGVRPTFMHGDLTRGNMLLDHEGVWLFDWRPTPVHWGDQRYDLAKLWSGCRVDWETARRGDFRPPARGPEDEKVLAQFCEERGIQDVPIIAGLCLLSSAPLHPAPFDEILVTRGVKLLQEFTCA